MTWHPDKDFAGHELDKVYPFVVPYTRGRVLDIGAGPNRIFPHWITLDSGKGWGERVADLPMDGSQPLPFKDNSFDAVVSSHYIEHIADWKSALAEWWRLVKVGGHLVLYWPDPDDYPRVGQPGANPDHKSDITAIQMRQAMVQLALDGAGGWSRVEDEARNGGDEYSLFQVYQKRADNDIIEAVAPVVGKRALVIRYGAFGDQIMASSILPGLKARNFHVTYNCEAASHDVIAHDPNIDAFLVQDKDQVPNAMLSDYWAKLSTRYDKVVNLCESVEGSLLLLPDRLQYQWDHDTRHRLCNKNYLEHTHDLAGIPYEEMAPAFFPTKDEIKQCAGIRAKFGDGPVILWTLAGSSAHKVWPYAHHATVRLLHETDATIILAGDKSSAELESAIEEAAVGFYGSASRIVRTSGLWPIRATMAFALTQADVVVGPETGVLNAVSHAPVPKVVMLSHSSAENLTKHWARTEAIEPMGADCYPCHRLHMGWGTCPRDDVTGAALCAAAISAGRAVSAIKKAMQRPAAMVRLDQEAAE